MPTLPIPHPSASWNRLIPHLGLPHTAARDPVPKKMGQLVCSGWHTAVYKKSTFHEKMSVPEIQLLPALCGSRVLGFVDCHHRKV